MKYLILVIAFTLSQLEVFSQEYAAIIGDKYVVFNVSNGMLNGPYQSYKISVDANGDSVKTIFTKGEFSNNKRSGSWLLFSDAEEILVERFYNDLFNFENKKPFSTEPIINLLSQPIYSIKRDSSNVYEYFYLRERDLAYSKRVWRELRPKHNEFLFHEAFTESLIENIKNGKITSYSTDNFRGIIEASDLPDISNYSIVAFRIKEDFVIDYRRQVGEYRPLGFCPVFKNNQTGEEMEFCWLYYPYIRSFLAQQIVPEWYDYETAEDLIFMRNFSGNVYDCSELKKCQSAELNTINPRLFDILLMEDEHDYWKKFAGY